jgi:molybdate transport system substrate-binding protein
VSARPGAAVVFLAALSALCGCRGGGDQAGSPAGPPLAKAKAADAAATESAGSTAAEAVAEPEQELEGRLLFHAGTGQRAALDELAGMFEAKHPKVKVDFSYKGSGYFLADILASHEGDLFMPGEAFYVDQAMERGLIEEYDPAKDTAAYFVTVIITPKGNPKDITCIEDFAKPGVRVGLGDPKACAVGEWHERIFEKAGVLDAVKRNTVQSAQCIPELGNATKLGAIDGTIVWAPTAAVYLQDCEVIPMPADVRAEVPLPVVVLTDSKDKPLARAMQQFVLSDEGRECFHHHAYVLDLAKADEDIDWLVKAAQVAKDPSIPISEETCGPLVGEVTRQRR